MILFGKVCVDKGVSTEINAILEENAELFIEKVKSSQVTQNIFLKEKIDAPIEKGDVIGEATFSVRRRGCKKCKYSCK